MIAVLAAAAAITAVLGDVTDMLVILEHDPERASRVFQQVLRQPDFTWARDGEALLRQHKAGFFERPALPSIMPIGGAALDHPRFGHQHTGAP